MNHERYLVKSYGDNVDGTKQGLIKFLQLCENHGNGVIVVPQLQNVKNTMLSTVLGEKLTKKLVKDRIVNLNDSATISLCSSNTLNNFQSKSVYLALWGSKYTIQDIEENCYNWKSLVLVTWLPEDSEEWVRENTVTVIYDDKKSEEVKDNGLY